MIPKVSENPKGLHQRYIVAKSNGQPIDPEAEYFVLRLDKNGKDPIHIQACREAIMTYAEHIQKHLPELAIDLINRYGFERLILPGVMASDEEALTEHNTNVVAQFMEHCKQENLEIPDRMFETFFDA